MHQAGGLLARAAKDEAAARFVHGVRQLFKSLQARGIDGGHVSQSKDYDGGQFRKFSDDFFDLVGGAEKKGRSEEHTSELQSRRDLVCRLLLEKKKIK